MLQKKLVWLEACSTSTIIRTLLIIFLVWSTAQEQASAQEVRVRPGEILLKFKSLSTEVTSGKPMLASALGGSVLGRTKSGISRVAFSSALQSAGELSADGKPGAAYDKEYFKRICDAYLATGQVELCSPNFIIQVHATPNDTSYSSQVGTELIGLPTAWDTTTCSSDVIVAVVDTGIDYTHPDLAANIWQNSAEIVGNGVDDDGDGYVDDIYGVNVVGNSGNPMDDNSHGTHVAGTIGATGNNAVGIAGICWNVKLMGVKFLSSDGSGSLYDAVVGIEYAVAHKARIINASWGSYGYSSMLLDAIQKANAAGTIFIAAAGNESTNTDVIPHYPSAFNLPGVVSVAAVEGSGALAEEFSNYGATTVDLGAPGVSVLSTVPGNSYAEYSGTSMASPHVSGVAAMLLSARPDLDVDQIKSALLSSVTSNNTLASKTVSGGVLNAAMALQVANILPPGTGGAGASGTGPSYSLSVAPAGSAQKKSGGTTIRGAYIVSVGAQGVSGADSLALKLSVSGARCAVKQLDFDSTLSSSLSGKLYTAYSGQAKLTLTSTTGATVAQAKITYRPRGVKASKLSAASASKACRAIAKRIR